MGRSHVGPNDAAHANHEFLHTCLFFLMFAILIASQIGLFVWKKYYYHSFLHVTLLGLWILPIIGSIYLGFFRMIFIWSIFSIITGYLIVKASQSPLYKETPSRVYGWFFMVYKASYTLSIVGYVLVMAEFVGISHLLIRLTHSEVFHSVVSLGALLMFYGLYFGVLGRDCAEMCTTRLASTMGFTGKGIPSKILPPRTCCICGDHFNPLTAIELPCSHSFHHMCIKGWTIIGKKDTCPYCSEKVPLGTVFSNPWQRRGMLWANLLDSLRYLIVWNHSSNPNGGTQR